jgi:hypothetical protein
MGATPEEVRDRKWFIIFKKEKSFLKTILLFLKSGDRLCILVVRVPGYRSTGPDSIPGATRFFEK